MSREQLGGIPARLTVTQVLTNQIFRLPPVWRRAMLMAWDALSWIMAMLVLVVIRYDLRLTAAQWAWALLYTAAAIIIQIALGLFTHVYLGRGRVGSFSEASWIGTVVLLTSIPLGLILSVVTPDFPRGVALLAPPLALTFMAAGRWFFHTTHASVQPHRDEDAVKAIVYGAGEAGHQVALLVDKAETPPYRIVGFVDDDADKRLRVRSYRVLGTGDDLINAARDREAEMVILAISNASPQLIQQVSDQCKAHGLELIVIPSVREMIGGHISLASLRQVSVDDLLGSRPINTDLSSVTNYVTGKRVLVTGAGGSIGSELARQLHKLGPSKLILLDREGSALHGVQLDHYGNGLLNAEDLVLCDIRDHEALCAVVQHQSPDVVFHAAALKHLPMVQLRCAHDAGASQS